MTSFFEHIHSAYNLYFPLLAIEVILAFLESSLIRRSSPPGGEFSNFPIDKGSPGKGLQGVWKESALARVVCSL